jgi:bifunctional UDP-N-acetylglucosamine pyrophosphorylase/glucosamine-1-phosphate N-acetyltransferase
VITDNVPPGAIGVARSRQRTIRDWVLRRRSGTASAVAALAAQQSDQQSDLQGQPDSDTGTPAGDNDLRDPRDPRDHRNGPSSEGTDA